MRSKHCSMAAAAYVYLCMICMVTSCVDAFLPHPLGFMKAYTAGTLRSRASMIYSPLNMARYGPTDENLPSLGADLGENFMDGQEKWEKENEARVVRQQQEFGQLLEKVMATENLEFLPSLLTKNLELILSIEGFEGVKFLKDTIEKAKNSGDEDYAERVIGAADYILEFVQEFVDQTRSIDDGNKKLLGKIIRAVARKHEEDEEEDDTDIDAIDVTSGVDTEKLLDELLEQEKENFTPGFLRHIEGECNRISGAPTLSRESGRLLETLRIIQARVVEELGKDLGEGAQVLGQLLGYDDRTERLAVLDAGLTVRGARFASEMRALTLEAIDGFEQLPGGVDPELVLRVKEIDERIEKFIKKQV